MHVFLAPIKFACAFVSPDNSGIFNLLACSTPGTRNRFMEVPPR